MRQIYTTKPHIVRPKACPCCWECSSNLPYGLTRRGYGITVSKAYENWLWAVGAHEGGTEFYYWNGRNEVVLGGQHD